MGNSSDVSQIRWMPFLVLLGGVAVALGIPVLYGSVFSEDQMTPLRYGEIAGSYLKLFGVCMLLRGLGEVEKYLGRSPWWKRLGRGLGAIPSWVWGSLVRLFSDSETKTLEANVEDGISAEVRLSAKESVEYEDLEARVNGLEKRVDGLQDEFKKLESRQVWFKERIRTLFSEIESVEERIEGELETVWNLNLEMEVVALVWLGLGQLISAHPSLPTRILGAIGL